MEERIRIGILMGGQSLEREVSMASGCHLLENLDRTRYEVYPIEIGVDGKWYHHHTIEPLVEASATIPPEFRPLDSYEAPSPVYSELVTARVMRSRVDLMLPALHGPGGEDGSIQGFLQTLQIPYAGSGILASSLTMDKARCKFFIRAAGLPTPDWVFFSRRDWEKGAGEILEKIQAKLPTGGFVKPNDQGSSIGISRFGEGADPSEAICKALRYAEEVLVEKALGGRELTCGVYGKERPEALPVTEIRTNSDFFDYFSKYQAGGAEEITPAEISEDLTQKIQSLAIRTHRVFGCAGITRTDFILDGEEPSIIEINTIPGMTRMSLIPRACAAAGLAFDAILDRVIGETLFRDEVVPMV